MAPQSFRHDLEAQLPTFEASSNGNGNEHAVYLDASVESQSRHCTSNSEFTIDIQKQEPCSESAGRITNLSNAFIQPARCSSELAAEVEHLTRQLDAARAKEDLLTREKTKLISSHQREMDDLRIRFSEFKIKQDIDISLLDLEKTFLTRKVHKAESKLAQSKANIDDLKQVTRVLQTTIDKYRADSAAEIRNLKAKLDNDKKNISAEHQKTKATLQAFQSTTSSLQKHIHTAYAANRALENDTLRFKRESEEAKAKLEEYEATAETLRMRFAEMEAGMEAAKIESDRMRAELEEYCEGTTELEAENARLASGLEAAEKRMYLVTMNNELLLQTVSDLRSPNPNLEGHSKADCEALQAEYVRLAEENLQLQERLQEYEEQEVEGAVFDYEDQSFDHLESDSHSSGGSVAQADHSAGETLVEHDDTAHSLSGSDNDGTPSC
ncbi:hypothetical protein ARMGADRAFT_1059854 [Armillaria gallica]|uniref:Uncharacterized protein n=1 Tax=Armillaria gallica TaxID=47427 RepID=A0A2H3EL78_ARMGA|nr:hypothetical protein ARMGADRAFT_1059854 [Armillaria gallica]